MRIRGTERPWQQVAIAPSAWNGSRHPSVVTHHGGGVGQEKKERTVANKTSNFTA